VLILSISSIITALMIFLLTARQRRKAGIPAGRVIYIDSSQWKKVEKPLIDKELHLTGKPDYLVRQGRQVIPVEVKSGHAPPQPHPWHISQLMAYCMLVENAYGTRPGHGVLHYVDQTLALDFTPALEASTLAMIREMQGRSSQVQIERSHHDQYRCLHCGYKSICDRALEI
jgi:CRISPR-associated exonuclease Cas4